MKISYLIAFLAALLLCISSCTTEDYYRSANLSPELMASADLDKVDTIKTSAVSSQRNYTMSVTATDENMNMNMLFVSSPTGSVEIDGVAANSLALEAAKERGEFIHNVEFAPNNDGLHTITARVTDDFGNSSSLEKKVYSFTNMRPKVVIQHVTQRVNVFGADHFFDFSTSFDRDTQWGGAIDSMFVLAKSLPYIEATGDIAGGTYPIFQSVAAPYPTGDKTDRYILRGAFYDDGIDFFTDVWVWVKDNEGAVSDTLHFNIGHVE